MSRTTARFTLDPAFTVGEVGPPPFRSFVEHLGRCVRTGVFEPDHPSADGTGLRTDVLGLVRKYGETDLLDATAVRAADRTVTVLAVNRSRTEPLTPEVALGGLGLRTVTEHSALADAGPDARNTLDDPERVTPHPVEGTALADGTLTAVREPLPWNVIRPAQR